MTLLHQGGGLAGKVPAAQVRGLEFNPQHPGNNSGVTTSACDPNVRRRQEDGWAQRSASPPEVSVSEVSVRDCLRKVRCWGLYLQLWKVYKPFQLTTDVSMPQQINYLRASTNGSPHHRKRGNEE